MNASPAPAPAPALDLEALFALPPLSDLKGHYQREGTPERIDLDLSLLRGREQNIGVHDPPTTDMRRKREMLSGLLRRIGFAPGSAVKVGADLHHARQQISIRSEHGVGIIEVKSPWLELEGTLRDGVRFRLEHRTDSISRSTHTGTQYVTVRTERTETWSARLQLSFPAGRYEQIAAGPRRDLLTIPEGIELQRLDGGPAHLELAVTSPLKWDALPPGGTLDGIDGAAAMGLLFANAYLLLGAAAQTPFLVDQSQVPAPRMVAVPPSAYTRKRPLPAFAVTVAGVLLAAAIGFFALDSFWNMSHAGGVAEDDRRQATKSVTMRKHYLDKADEEDTKQILYGVAGGVGSLLAVGALAGGVLFGKRLRAKERERAATWEQRLAAARALG